MAKLSPEEKEFVNKIQTELEFYERYKVFINEVKGVYLDKGPEAARQFIRSKTDDILTIACDELFWSLFHKL